MIFGLFDALISYFNNSSDAPEFIPFLAKFFFVNLVSNKSTQDNSLLSQKPLFEVDPPKIQIWLLFFFYLFEYYIKI